MRERGVAHPVVIVLILLLATSLVIFYSYNKSSNKNRVKGVSNSINANGFSVNISSSDNWDFVEYLCSDLDNCIKNSTISGGAIDMHELIVMKDLNWNNASYIKLFAKPGWSSPKRKFHLNITNTTAKSTTVVDDGISYDAVIIPIENISADFLDSVAVFSDQAVK